MGNLVRFVKLIRQRIYMMGYKHAANNTNR
jgi:hypothetical protein